MRSFHRGPSRPHALVLALFLALFLALGCTEASDPVAPPGDVLASRAPAVDAALASPLFALASAPGGTLAVGEATGIRLLRPHESVAFSSLPNVTGLAPIAASYYFALTGGRVDPAQLLEGDRKLYRVTRSRARVVANLWEFELNTNPDQIWNTLPPDSNPFDLVRLDGRVFLVADAAANDLLRVDESGAVDWVAVLTPRLASTDNVKRLFGCSAEPLPPPCVGLPEAIPAQPVATSVAVGPDGAYYVGELTGFPAEPGIARVWRIEPGSLHVVCPGAGCTLFADGFTSIMDLEFGPDGTLYVVEFDGGTWFAVNVMSAGGPLAPVEGGRVKACDAGGVCQLLVDGLDLPTAITLDRDGRIWIAENETIPGAGSVRQLLP